MGKEEERILQNIQSVKIQGASNIAKAGIGVYVKNPSRKLKREIISIRPTEPLLQNSLRILENSKDKKTTARKLVEYMDKSKLRIAINGARLVGQDINIFSHCHSSTVMEILKYAKRVKKKKFIVYTLEVEPLLQGRQTAKELAKEGIKVIVFPDLAAREAIKKCDLFLFGADAYTKKGVANKIGTETLCRLARELKIPAYSCGVSLKYTKKVKIEYRPGKEVWDERNENIKVINPAFDFTKKKYLSGVVSELGTLPFKEFIREAKKMFSRFS